MALAFSNSTRDIVSLDPNAGNPDYELDPVTGKYVLKKLKLPSIVDQSGRERTNTPTFVDQSSRGKTEGTGDKVPYVNPQAGRGKQPPKPAPPKPEEVSGVPAVVPTTGGLDDTKTGTGRSTETNGIPIKDVKTDTDPIVDPPIVVDPPVVADTVVDDDPFADPVNVGRFAEGGQTDTSYDDPGPNYNPQFDTPVATTPVTHPTITTPPVVDDPPLSEKDQLAENIRAANKTGRTPDPADVARLAELTREEAPEVDAGIATYNSFQQEIQSAISAGQPGGLPSKDEIRANQFLSGDQKTALLAMYPKEEKPEPEVDAGTQAYNSFQQKIESAISSGQLGGLPSKDEIQASRFLSGEQKTALFNMYPPPAVAETPVVDPTVDPIVETTQDGMSEEEFNALSEEDQLVERIRRANKAGLPPKQEWLDRLDEITKSQEKLSLGTAEFQSWSRRASAGDVNIDEIKGLNLTPYQEENLINSYNRGLADRATANQLAIDQQAEEDKRLSDKAEQDRIAAEYAAEQQRKQDEIDEAANTAEKKRVEDRHNLVQGFKDKLLADPDFVVNMDQLRGSDPTAADDLQRWMETSMEYAQAVKAAGLSGEGKAPDKPVLTSTGVVVNGDADATDTTEDPDKPILTAEGVVLPTDTTPEAPILTAEGVEFPGDAEAEETTETFLNRMPAVPTNLDNVDALNWLADQGISEEDGQKWADWARSSGRTATEDPERPTFYDDPEKPADANLEQYATITPDLDPEAIKGLVDSGFDTPSIVRAGELYKSDGSDAFNGYLEAVQAGTSAEWETNYADLKAAEDDGEGGAEDDDEIDSIYVVGSPEYNAAVAAVNIEDLILRIPEPPTDLNAFEKFFWLASQVDDAGNPLLTATEAQAYYEWSKNQQADIDSNTSVDGDGGLGDASDPANLERIQGTIADEIEKVVQDMGFNSDEYKASQTTAIDARYEDARVRLGRQFAIDPGGTKTGRAQRAFETIENQRIQDLATLDTEVQDRLQAARDSTITNLVNAFSSITTGKMAEDQLNEQERQFNTELRESVRQFNNDIALRLKEFGLSETEVEAAINKINSDIVNNTRSISATISQAWADVTGDVGVPGGVISLEDLGIPESEWSMFPYLPASDEMKNTIKMSFEAMLGRSITDDEMTNLMSNGRIKVDDNMPTQRAKEFAATITQQNMDRISQYDAIAESNGLDRDKFTDAKERADKDWARTNLEVAEEFGLDNNTFRNSMWDLDQRLSKIFFNEDYTEVERDRQRRNAINDVSRLYFPDEQGAFLQAKDQYDILYGDRERAIATAFGMDGDTFARANRQADTQEARMLNVWSSLLADVETETMEADSDWRRQYEQEMSDPDKQSVMDRARGIPIIGRGIKFLFPERDITDTAIDFTWDGEFNQALLSGIGETVLAVEGMDDILTRLNPGPAFFDTSEPPITIVPAGTPGAEPRGVSTYNLSISPNKAVDLFLDNASQSDIANINEAFNLSLPAGALQNDDTLRRNLMSYFIAVQNAPDGEGPGPFNISYTPGDWFSRLDPTAQSGIMSLLGTTNFSPERAAGGTSALASIGRAFGIGAGAVIGGAVSKGNPAAITAGAQAGGAIVP